MRRRGLIEAVREAVRELLGGYLPSPEIREDIDGYIRRPALGERAGVLGAIALAQPED